MVKVLNIKFDRIQVTWQTEILMFGSAQIFQKSSSHVKIPDPGRVIWSMFHTEVPPISRCHCTKFSHPGVVTPSVCTHVLLLKLAFKPNNRHLNIKQKQNLVVKHQATDSNLESTEWVILNFLLTGRHFHLEIMNNSCTQCGWESMWGPLCSLPFIMITLSLWVTESVHWVSTWEMDCTSLPRCVEVTMFDTNCIWRQYRNNRRETCKGHSPVRVTGFGRRRSATSFCRLSLL
jgi:hypothetical protein